MADTRAQKLLAEIAELASQLEAMETLAKRRTELFREGRAMTPPLTNKVLADAAGVTTIAVIQAIKRAEVRDAKPKVKAS